MVGRRRGVRPLAPCLPHRGRGHNETGSCPSFAAPHQPSFSGLLGVSAVTLVIDALVPPPHTRRRRCRLCHLLGKPIDRGLWMSQSPDAELPQPVSLVHGRSRTQSHASQKRPTALFWPKHRSWLTKQAVTLRRWLCVRHAMVDSAHGAIPVWHLPPLDLPASLWPATTVTMAIAHATRNVARLSTSQTG